MLNNLTVSKSNKLIETSYRLGRREQWFVLFLISKMDSMKQMELESYQMSLKDIKDIVNHDGVKRIANNGEVFDLMSKLNQTPIRWETEEEKGQMVWISSLVYDKRKEMFTFSFDQQLKPFLLEIKKYFTKYALSSVSKFKSAHSIRIYEIVKMRQAMRSFSIPVDKFKFMIGVGEKYDKFYHLNKRVLIPSQKEINLYSDINFDYQPIKKGRNITAIRFQVWEKEASIINMKSAYQKTKVAYSNEDVSPEEQKEKDIKRAEHERQQARISTFILNHPEKLVEAIQRVRESYGQLFKPEFSEHENYERMMIKPLVDDLLWTEYIEKMDVG